jgi:hypothetical protein
MISYDSVGRTGIDVQGEAGWVRHTIYDPRPLKTEGKRVAAAVTMGVGGLIAAGFAMYSETWFLLIHASAGFLGAALVALGIRRRRQMGALPTVVDASAAEGLKISYFYETVREVSFGPREVTAVCVRKGKPEGKETHFYALDFLVAGKGQYRLVFVAKEGEEVYWMSARIREALGLPADAPDPPAVKGVRVLNSGE